MLRFFRLNDPYRLIFVLLAVLALGTKAEIEISKITLPELNGVLVGEMMANGKSMYSEVWHPMPPVAAFAQYLLDFMFDRSLVARHITSVALIFIQAALFGFMLISTRAFNESNYLPSFVYAVLSFFSFDTIGLTGELIGACLLLLAMNSLLKEIDFKKQRDETIHNLGFYLGLASLAVFSNVVFFVGVAILLFLFTRVEFRRFGLYVIGFLLPHLVINLWYYWHGSIDLLWQNFYIANLNFNTQSLFELRGLLILAVVPIAYFVFSLIMMRRDARLTKYQSQIAQVMFLWLVLGIVETYFGQTRTPQSLLVCAPPIAYFISHYFLLIRRKWIAETMMWLFVITLLVMNSLSIRNFVPGINLSKIQLNDGNRLNFSGKKILVMEDDMSPYVSNSTSTYFLDWNLSQHIFKEPDVYQHVLVVSKAFEEDPPDVIIDHGNNLKGVLPYLPQVREKYRREGDHYIRIP
jgi:hypothetical protein